MGNCNQIKQVFDSDLREDLDSEGYDKKLGKLKYQWQSSLPFPNRDDVFVVTLSEELREATK